MMRERDPFKDIYEKMNKLFENSSEPGIQGFYQELPVDIRETEDQVNVKADMPGVDKESIQVKVRDQTLYLSSKGEKEIKEEGKDYIRHERSSKKYSRRIGLPSSVDSDTAKARYENGVLTVEMDKKESSKDYNVEVK